MIRELEVTFAKAVKTDIFRRMSQMRTVETLGSLHLKTTARQKKAKKIDTKKEVVPVTGSLIGTEGGWERHIETEIVTETDGDRGLYKSFYCCGLNL